MKKTIIPFILLQTLFITSCSELETVVNSLPTNLSTQPSKPQLTNAEVVSGLKEALQVGIKNSVNLTSVADGFLNNASIRLPFPEDAMKVKQKALDWGLTSQVEKFETTLNHAAEEATKEALPIFINAITNMSLQDGFTILKGGDGAATKFLKDNTTTQLVEAFSPKVKDAIAKVKLTEYWNPIITKYNAAMKVSGGEKINPDLNAYVTEKAIKGLFFMVEQEENKIRQNPAARVTDLLAKVFGSI